MIREKKILFTHWDGGRGHINRILDVADESKKRGYRIGIITTKAISHSLPFAFDNTYIIPTRPPLQPPPDYELPLYSHARSHGQRLRGLGFSRDFILSVNKQEQRAVDDFIPDVVVNDYRDTIKNVTDISDIPLVGIVQSNGHPSGQQLGWFIDVADTNIPSCLNEFNEARTSKGLDALSDEREMFAGDYQIIPSVPEIDPIEAHSSQVDYVGLLSYRYRNKPINNPSILGQNDKKVVCNVTPSNRQKYGQEDILKAIPQSLNVNIMNIDESGVKVRTIKQRLGIFATRRFIDHNLVLPGSSVFITYGGHGSVLSALKYGVPILGLGPYSSEQHGTLQNIQSYGAGLILPHGSQIKNIHASDMGDMNIYGYWQTSITANQIIRKLQTILNEDYYSLRAMDLANKLEKAGGAIAAVDAIEKQI
jgi:UDP:flavonoid glycosyltransferase YjiC (YdhE family)